MVKAALLVAASAIAGAAAFSPAAVPALRQSSAAVTPLDASRTSYSRNFGYPCSDGRGLIPEDASKVTQKKTEGWVYRPVGEKQEFSDGASLYKTLDSQVKASKVNVRRWHNQKSH